MKTNMNKNITCKNHSILLNAFVVGTLVLSSSAIASLSKMDMDRANIQSDATSVYAEDDALSQETDDEEEAFLETEYEDDDANMNPDMVNGEASTVNYAEVTPAQLQTKPVEITLDEKIVGDDGELLATQPGRVEVNQAVNPTMQRSDYSEYDMKSVESIEPRNMPSLRGESGTTASAQSTPITLQQKVKDKRGELLATQPGEVVIQESRNFVEE